MSWLHHNSKLRMTKLCALLGGSGACSPENFFIWGIFQEEIFENMLRLMRFGVYFETEMAIFIKK